MGHPLRLAPHLLALEGGNRVRDLEPFGVSVESTAAAGDRIKGLRPISRKLSRLCRARSSIQYD